MSEFRTFSGKTVDEAMEEACRQLGEAREKLEIEIMSGGSSGIFGLVGKKKAQVRARLREEINLLGDLSPAEPKPAAPRPERAPRPAKSAPAKPAPVKAEAKPIPAKAEAKPAPAPAPQPEPVCEPAPRPVPVAMDETDIPDLDTLADDEEFDDIPVGPAPSREIQPREERQSAPQTPPQPLGPELEALVREVMDIMLDGILGQIPDFEISGNAERVTVLIRDEENSGLLIGREGQTLAAIQYLVNRMVIRRHGDPVKVQINTGEYRERQDDNLRKMAIFLADKAKSLGRPQSTKPLSSYHRRVVHLALQEDEGISTRSKGDGPLKRVLIVPRGSRGGEPQNGQRS
jgi:spoIIIJ-associated protein